MKIVPIEHGLTLAAPAEGYVRSPGLHMSQLYGSLFEGLEPERFGSKDGGPDPLKLELGLALEEGLEEALLAIEKCARETAALLPNESGADHVHAEVQTQLGRVLSGGAGEG